MIVRNIEQTAAVTERGKFGGFNSDGVYIVSEEAEANAIFKHFALFSKNKQLLNE